MNKGHIFAIFVFQLCIHSLNAQKTAETGAQAAPQSTTTQMTVEQMFDLIEENSSQLRTAKTGTEAAAQAVSFARSGRLPDVTIQAQASYLGNTLITDRDFSNGQWFHTPHFGNSFSIMARQTIYAGGAISSGIDMAQMEQQKSQLNVEQQRENMRFSALGFYLDLCKIDNRLQVIDKNIELTSQLISNINDKYAQGLALKNDVTRYELQMKTLELQRQKLQDQRTILNHQLCNLTGLTSYPHIEPASDLASATYPQDNREHWQALADSTPAQRQAALSVQMAQKNEKTARANLLPHVALVAADNLNGPITFELPPIDQNYNYWFVGIGVDYELSSLFKGSKRLKQTRLQARQAMEAKEVTATETDNQLQAAFTLYQQAYIELDTRRKSVELARQNYTVVNDRYLNQLALVTDMLDASNMLLNTELDHVDALIGIAYAFFRMKYITGTL